jgi:glycosyltransferase involved in cell wall biosynthesis
VQEQVDLLLGVPRARVHVVTHHFTPVLERRRMPRGRDDEPVVLFFGRIWEYKGLEYLIRAEPLITQRVPGAKIVIAGEGEDFSRYERMMVHPERFVVHNEYVSHEKRSALFRQAAVVALPYVDATQSGVIPVAYSHGRPVVATTTGSLPDMVDHGETGYLVSPRDERALAGAIVHLLQDRALRERMGENGRRKLEAECSPDVAARGTVAVYEAAIGR